MNKSANLEMKSPARKTLSKQVIEQIVYLLRSRQLSPGDKLPSEMELIRMLDVSRPVLREAMSSLENMGIIKRKTRGGTYFCKTIGSEPFSLMLALSLGDMRIIMETRMSLELGLVALAAEKITKEELDKLKVTIKQMEMDENYSENDKEFHRIIVFSASNPMLEGIITPLLNMLDEVLSKVPKVERDETKTIKYHRDIYEALLQRDPLLAYEKMYDHLNYAREKVLRIVDEHEEKKG